MIALKNILVATDFGEAAASALTYGRSLARTFGAKLVLLNVADDLLAQVSAYGGYVTDLGDEQTQMETAARKALEDLLTDEDRRDLGAKTVVMVSRSPAWAILQYAQKNPVNLIIIGTHGRGPLGHLFLGSVAERVVRVAPCPVLTVRHPEHEFVLPDALTTVARV